MEEPWAITNSVEEAGVQSVFDANIYQKAIGAGTYTAGGVLFGVNFALVANTRHTLPLARGAETRSDLVRDPDALPRSTAPLRSPLTTCRSTTEGHGIP